MKHAESGMEHSYVHHGRTDTCTGNFIFRNYRQALNIIKNDGTMFAEFSVHLKITPADCESYLEQERDYLEK